MRAHANKLVRRSSPKSSAQRGSSWAGGEVNAFFFPRGMEINSTRGVSGVRQRRRQPSKTALPSLTNRASALVGGSIFEAATAMEHFQTTASHPRAAFAPTMLCIVDTERSKRRTNTECGRFVSRNDGGCFMFFFCCKNASLSAHFPSSRLRDYYFQLLLGDFPHYLISGCSGKKFWRGGKHARPFARQQTLLRNHEHPFI